MGCDSLAETHCRESKCPVGTLAESDFCGDTGEDCSTLKQLGTGCIGSHTEQTCEACAGRFVRAGIGDDVSLFYQDGKLAAVKRNDKSTATCEAWFGIDLSDCVDVGNEVTVLCRQVGE